jgi:hypothetical protein
MGFGFSPLDPVDPNGDSVTSPSQAQAQVESACKAQLGVEQLIAETRGLPPRGDDGDLYPRDVIEHMSTTRQGISAGEVGTPNYYDAVPVGHTRVCWAAAIGRASRGGGTTRTTGRSSSGTRFLADEAGQCICATRKGLRRPVSPTPSRRSEAPPTGRHLALRRGQRHIPQVRTGGLSGPARGEVHLRPAAGAATAASVVGLSVDGDRVLVGGRRSQRLFSSLIQEWRSRWHGGIGGTARAKHALAGGFLRVFAGRAALAVASLGALGAQPASQWATVPGTTR